MARQPRSGTAGQPGTGGKPDDHRSYGLDGWPFGGPSDAELAHAAETRLRRDMQAALERLRGGGDLDAYAEVVWLVWKRDPERVPYELVEASRVLITRASA